SSSLFPYTTLFRSSPGTLNASPGRRNVYWPDMSGAPQAAFLGPGRESFFTPRSIVRALPTGSRSGPELLLPRPCRGRQIFLLQQKIREGPEEREDSPGTRLYPPPVQAIWGGASAGSGW